MTDTYLHPEVHVVITQTPGVDGLPTAARLAQIEDDLAAMLGRPVIARVVDIPDVAGTPTDGQILTYNEAGAEWNVSDPLMGVSVQRSGVPQGGPVDTLNMNTAFNVSNSGGGIVSVWPVWGGTGSADSFARSDHTHQVPDNRRIIFGATATLSSGSRTLVSGTVTGLDPTRVYRATATLRGDLRGEGTGAGYTLPRITMAAALQSRFGDVRTVAGVDREFNMDHAGVTVSGVSSFAYSATIIYQAGDPIYVGAGELVITLRPNR